MVRQGGAASQGEGHQHRAMSARQRAMGVRAGAPVAEKQTFRGYKNKKHRLNRCFRFALPQGLEPWTL